MRLVKLRGSARRLRNLATASVLCSIAAWCVAPTATQNAAADGETRTLHLYHTHTGETIDATFRVDGHYDPAVLHELNHFLRDWRNNDEINMDPRLFDAIWEAYRSAGATDRIQIYSAYRSPETNAMLRRRSRAVAEHSQHMLGKAMDTTMPGFPMERVREAGMKLQHGGVGWYPSANFVHLDVGGVRSWPRMSYDQLSDLFPDGKTVHIASNGQTLPGYEQARAELAQRGDTDLPPSQQDSGGFFAWLFGGGGGSGSGTAHEDEEDRRVSVASAAVPAPPAVQQQAEPQSQPQPVPTAVAAPEPAAQPAALAYAEPQAQTLDGRLQVADGNAQPQGTQVASLEPAASAPALTPADLPLPPRRPAEFAAVPEIPLPPARPGAPDTVDTAPLRTADAGLEPLHSDAIGKLITATASGVPTLRRSALPALITQGGRVRRRAPVHALAFAGVVVASDGPLDLDPPPPAARTSEIVRPMALRAVTRRHHAGASSGGPQVADASPPVVVGPRLTGLRRAARRLAEHASL